MHHAPTDTAVELRRLRKSFDRPAVDDLNLIVPKGEFYSLLGPNGAGKTTTLRMIAGLLRPDAGSISVFGVDALADRRRHTSSRVATFAEAFSSVTWAATAALAAAGTWFAVVAAIIAGAILTGAWLMSPSRS